MEKIFVDTSGWVALFVENDQNHQRAISIYEELKRQRVALYTSDYIIDETITTILVRSNHRQSMIAGSAILTSSIIKIVNVAPDYFLSTWELYKKYQDKELSFTDVSCLSIMKALGIGRIFSFDEELLQTGIQLINKNL